MTEGSLCLASCDPYTIQMIIHLGLLACEYVISSHLVGLALTRLLCHDIFLCIKNSVLDDNMDIQQSSNVHQSEVTFFSIRLTVWNTVSFAHIQCYVQYMWFHNAKALNQWCYLIGGLLSIQNPVNYIFGLQLPRELYQSARLSETVQQTILHGNPISAMIC